MTTTELSLTLENLKGLHSNAEDESSITVLGDLFEYCLKLYKLIENSSLSSGDELFQEAVSMCIKYLEKCTLMVNDLELFSLNETSDEIQTSSIKYLILPALLGYMNLKLQTNVLSDRLKQIKIAEVYFRDFLLRCKNYELCETSLKHFTEEFDEDNEEKSSPTDSDSVRQKKLQLFKLKKELEEKENNLKIVLERSDAEEYIRNYYMALVEKWILISIEEVEANKREKDLLQSIPSKENSSRSKTNENRKVQPLKPMIITRNEVEKKIFGLGYPSIPVMTIDDFYFQRFHNQIKQNKQPSGLSLQEKALKGDLADLDKDAEEIEKELLLDKDDPAALMKARQWDDWKDDNPRGSGNRMNKG